MVRLNLLLLIPIFFISCGKTGDIDAWTELDNPGAYEIFDLHFDENSGFIVGVGGKPWTLGTLHLSSDFGETWQVDSISEYALMTCHKLSNNEWLAGGLYGTLIRLSEDFLVKEVIRNRFHYLTDISSSENEILVVGYESFQSGIIQIYDKHLSHMRDTTIDQGFYSCHVKEGAHYVGGFGLATYKDNNEFDFQSIDEIGGDQITDIFTDQENIYFLGYGGKIFIKNSENSNWSEHQITSNFIRNPGFKKGIAIPSKNTLIVVGERGNVYISKDEGKKWESLRAPTEDYESLTYAPPYIIVGTRSGKIYRLLDDF